MTADITVVIPNWNGGQLLERALGAVARQSLAPKAVIVVDDGSTDDSPQAALRAGAELIRLDHNSGFSVAVNAGARAATTEWLLILNNDAILDENCLATLLSACQQHGAAFAAPKLLNLQQPERLDGSFDLLARSGCAWRAGHGHPATADTAPAIPAQFLPLTATLVNRAVFLAAGGLEERFESYLEDVEFSLRCALRGHSAIYVPGAIARHEASATLGAWSPRMVRLIARNQILLIARHWPRPWLPRYGWPILAGQLLWGLLAWQRGAGRAWLSGKWSGLRMFAAFRSETTQADPAALERILTTSESHLRRLQTTSGTDRYWSAYFLCVPESRP